MAQGITLKSVVAGIPGFGTWSVNDKILFFAWFFQRHGNRERFKPSEIKGCFDSLHIKAPTSIGAYFKPLVENRKPKLLKDSRGYRLEGSIFEALDAKYGSRASTIAIIETLANLPSRVVGVDERDYLNEALTCFKNGAFRAAIVMTWNLAYDHFLRWLLADASRLAAFNAQLPKVAPEAKLLSGVSGVDDFGFIKEDKVLLVAKSARVIDGNLQRAMQQKLGLRNSVAHPSSLVITQLTAEEAIQNLIDNVVLKLK